MAHPGRMDARAAELLGFPEVLRELEGLALSVQGRELLRAQQISGEEAEVERRKALAGAFRRLLESGKPFPALDFPDIGPLQARCAKQGALFEAAELAALGRFLVSALRLKRHLAGETGLAAIAADIADLRNLSREIFSHIDRDGAVREDRIPSLRAIRDRIRSLQKEADRLAQSYLTHPDYRDFWQSALPGQKNGRLVLPLRANFKGRIPGIVHDVSATGSTLFLEPLDIVEKNNEVTERENEYRRELTRLLRQLSAAVTQAGAEVAATVAAVAELDAYYARAAYAVAHRCAHAEALRAGLNLVEARHPLLGGNAVPISLALTGGTRVLVITGPNTGGKTVSLKTVGLLALLNQFGMQIPAAEGSGLAVFDAVLADIGDEQSIEQNLSTFSAHVINAARILRGSGPRSLVLFDELGAGTDPEEGVAIAMSLLDHFIEKGCLCLATTHHGVLKNYGYTRAGVGNASMEFDLASLQPTYRILMGVPGESHALEIARRNGIPEALIRRAAAYLQQERGEAAELLDRLSRKHRELAAAEREQGERGRQLAERTRQTDLLNLRLRQRERELREKGLAELEGFLRESRREYERLIQRLRQEGEPAGRRETLDFLHGLEALARRQEGELRAAAEEPGPAEELRAGMEVLVRSTGKVGRILRRGKGNRWIVATESLRAELAPAELAAAPRQAEAAPAAPVVSEELADHDLSHQLDLRGLRLEEALRRLEQQLDHAVVRGLPEFSVVHGLGEGILQRGIHDYLRGSPLVKDYFFATPEEGGFGKTVVRLG
jgi:DNA mismatch repair protein MutS2